MGPFRLLCALVVFLGLFAPSARIANGEETEVVFQVSTPRFELTSDGVSFPGSVLNDVPGAPALPVYGTVVELPASGEWELSAVPTGVRVLPERLLLKSVPVPLRDEPTPDGGSPLLQAADSVRTVMAPDPKIYNQDGYYPLSVALPGAEQWHQGRRLLPVRVFPFQYNPVKRELLYHPEITITVRFKAGATDTPRHELNVSPSNVMPETPAANELGALRIRTGQRGLYRLTYADLAAAGVPVATVNPDSFQMTYLGQPIQIQVLGLADGFGDGDMIVFYAEPYVGRWMTSNVYRFSYGSDAAPPDTRMTQRSAEQSGPVVTQITQTLHIERPGTYYYDFYISTEADHFFDNPLYPSTSGTPVVTRSYDLPLDDPLISVGSSMTISGLLYGGRDQAVNPDNWAKLSINAHDVATFAWDGRKPYTITAATAPMDWLDQSPNALTLVADVSQVPGVADYWYNPDFLEVAYPALADAEADRIELPALVGLDAEATSVELRVTGFTTSTVNIYDVRNARQPVQLLTSEAVTDTTSTQITFWDAWSAGAPPPAYSLSTWDALLAPIAVEVDAPSMWRSPSNTADLIAIVHSSLWDAIQPLLDYHASQGVQVAKVDVQDVYDEFNYGRLHQNAIRDFLEYAYLNWNQGGPRPKYVLLVGDATPDYRNSGVTTLKNLVPAFLINIDPWIIETAADNRFVSFDGPNDFLPEMSIGRIPAQNAQGVTDYVNKALNYVNSAITPDGTWQSKVVYVADDNNNPAGRFHDLSEDIRLNWLPPSFSSSTIYYKSSTALDEGLEMKAAITSAFNSSAMYLQWFGHASRYAWGGETFMWQRQQVHLLAPNTQIPFMVSFSCWDGYFINMEQFGSESTGKTLAEVHVLEPGRGSIANVSPSGQHVGSALSILDQGLTKSFFQDKKAVIGDAVDAARLFYFSNSSVFQDVIDTSILFGDPVLALRLPAPLSAPEAPWVYIARNGQNIDLSWAHVGADASYYEVYRSTNPYPQPGVAPTNRIKDIPAGGAYGAGYVFVSTDDGIDHYAADGIVGPVQVIGDPAVNYFWVVRTRNSAGEVSDIQNIVGEFDFALVKGS